MLDPSPEAVAERAKIRAVAMVRDLTGVSWATVAWDGPLARFPGNIASDEVTRAARHSRVRSGRIIA